MNIDDLKELWIDKYRPHTVKDMVLDSEIKNYFLRIIESKSPTNMTLISSPGQGKTTLCLSICKDLNAETLFIPCAVEGRVETIQTKVKPFCDSVSIDGRPKIVVLDEIDSASATQESSFQKSLRNVIESATDTRFFCTANYNKIIPAVLSRCPAIKLGFTPKDLLIRLKYILDSEKIQYSLDTLKEFVKIFVKQYYPDIRSIINHLQLSCSNGKLVISDSVVVESKKTEFIKELIGKVKSEKNILNVRKYYIQNKDMIPDFVVFAGDVFNYVVENSLLSDREIIVKLSDILYQMNQVIDKEISFFAFISALSMGLSK